MQQQLQDKTIAILVENGFEQVELTKPQHALEQAGAQTHIVSPQTKTVKGWNHTDWGDTFSVDIPLDQADPANYDALLLPGGVMNPDYLRINPQAQQFVRRFFETDKPVAAICHGPWTLINAGVIDKRTVTSYPSIRVDLINAGANWVDQEVVVDRGLVTSRNPDDIPAFNRTMIDLFAHSHQEQRSDDRQEQLSQGTPSTAPNASFETGSDAPHPGFDSPVQTTFAHRNSEVRDSLPSDPYPPQADRNRSKAWQDRKHEQETPEK